MGIPALFVTDLQALIHDQLCCWDCNYRKKWKITHSEFLLKDKEIWIFKDKPYLNKWMLFERKLFVYFLGGDFNECIMPLSSAWTHCGKIINLLKIIVILFNMSNYHVLIHSIDWIRYLDHKWIYNFKNVFLHFAAVWWSC